MLWGQGRIFAAIALSALGGLAAAQAAIAVPSGQAITFLEQREEPEAGIIRLRFIAPDLASPSTRPAFDEVTADLEALCNDFGLKQMLKDAQAPERIIISLSAEKVEFGITNTAVEQVFEAFTVENGSCMLEMF